MLHTVVMLLLTPQNNVVEPHFRVNRINLQKQMLSFAVLCLKTQKVDTDIISIVNLARITHKKYITLEKICSSHLERIFEQMPTLKDVFQISTIKIASKELR